jgi:hypothetical protein
MVECDPSRIQDAIISGHPAQIMTELRLMWIGVTVWRCMSPFGGVCSD